MKTQEVLDPQRWAESTFGSAQLKDMRRTRRAVSTAAQMARDASASLPQQMQTWKDVKALYRLLDEPDATFEALMQPRLPANPSVRGSIPGSALGARYHGNRPVSSCPNVWPWANWQRQGTWDAAANGIGSRA